jgi:hypothetical protein
MFARRIVQKCLNENAQFVCQRNLHDWVQRLNTVSDDYAATEWEVVLLWALSKSGGTIQHEPSLGGRPIDIVFRSGDSSFQFGADIVTISDQGLHKRNPINQLREELTRRVSRIGTVSGGFSIRVNETRPTPSRGMRLKRQLQLPAINQFPSLIFNEGFERFLKAAQGSPAQGHTYVVQSSLPAVDVTITYEPGKAGVGTLSYGSYTSTTVIDDNPLYNALKGKAEQLKNSKYHGILGVFACDRSSRIFSESPHWATYSANEVVREFFRQYSSISFVVTIAVASSLSNFGGRSKLEFQEQVITRKGNEPWRTQLESLVNQSMPLLPKIKDSPENTVNRLKWNRSTLWTKPYLGGSHMSAGPNGVRTIRISSRELLDLLAGKLNYKRFAENHAITHGGENIFSIVRNQGAMIDSAAVEFCPLEDDDWIEFKFRRADPAVSPFAEPKSHQ